MDERNSGGERMKTFVDIVADVAAGAVAGAIAASTGFFKQEPMEDFDKEKFVTTVTVGAITGGVASYMGISMLNAAAILTDAGLTLLIENIAKTIYRRVVKKLRKKLG